MHNPRQYKARLLATESPTTSFPFFCLVKEVPLSRFPPGVDTHPLSFLPSARNRKHEENIPFVEDLATPI